MTASPILEIRELTVRLDGRDGPLTVLDRVSLTIERGEVLGLVGESGAGKSMTGTAVIGLLDPPLHIAGGEIRLQGARIDDLPAEAMRRVRGAEIGVVFQDPLTSLNPVFTIGHQLVETIREHADLDRREAREQAVGLLRDVGLPSPADRLDSYPHEFSGGMRQRVVIALALAGRPKLIIADEPTTALDVSIQAQIIALLKQIAHDRGMGVLLITHDMGVIAEAAERVAVLYAGRVAEVGPVADVLHRPQHPYTQALMRSIPAIGAGVDRLPQIPGTVPRLAALPAGCAFHPRCPLCTETCREQRPELRALGPARVACWAA